MQEHPLSQYEIAVIIIFVLLNSFVYFVFSKETFHGVVRYSLGFLLGMLAMYIAIHIYKWQ